MALIFLDGGAAPSIVLEGGVIREIRLGGAAPAGARRLDCTGCVVRPGEVDAHTHLYSGLAPLGMPPPAAPPTNFVEILQRVWWRLDRALDEASLRASARLYVAESLLAGSTALIDHHESPSFLEGSLDVLADAAQEIGCRLVTCYGATDRNDGEDEGRRGLEECRRLVRENARPLVRGLVGLHASFTVSDATVTRAGALARELGVPVHVHVAEDVADVDDARVRGAVGPLERLRSLGALPRGSIVAHGVHLSPDQVRAADEAGLWLVQNPRSNDGNRVGFASSLVASAHVALGTDGYPADMRAERAALGELARAAQVTPRVRADAGRELLSERFSARFAVEQGAAADLVVWRSADDAETPGSTPRHVVVAGEVVVEDGRLVRGDLAAIREEARREAERLWERMRRLS